MALHNGMKYILDSSSNSSSFTFWSSKFASKGQTKSKCFFQADVSSKKREELKTPKRHFEINWPLAQVITRTIAQVATQMIIWNVISMSL